jgi:hypothetical protein
MDSQLPIKILIIAILLGFAVVLFLPARGSRSSAIRRLTLLCMVFLAVLAVVFPSFLSDIASFVGVGRGTDLLLYGFIVVLIGQMLSQSRHRRVQEQNITELARREAIRTAQAPRSTT